MDTISASIPPTPKTSGSEGNGEGVVYAGSDYYYRVGQKIPKDKVVSLRHEGCWCGRQRGDIDYIVVAWNGKSFSVLEHVFYSGVREAMNKFKNLSLPDSIRLVEDREKKQKAELDALPRCVNCGKEVVLVHDNQPSDVCLRCFKK